MTWDLSECKKEYTESIEYLLNTLGLSCVDFDLTRNYLLPYQVRVVKYLNGILITLGSDNIAVKIDKILTTISTDTDNLCDLTKGEATLASTLGVDTTYTDYNTERFIYSWTNATSTLVMRIKFQYAYLFDQEDDPEYCKCLYPAGETEEEYESWTSGVNPQDEIYDRANYSSNNSAWVVSKDRKCDCYRRSNEEDE